MLSLLILKDFSLVMVFSRMFPHYVVSMEFCEGPDAPLSWILTIRDRLVVIFRFKVGNHRNPLYSNDGLEAFVQ